jgi:hypothetical protein
MALFDHTADRLAGGPAVLFPADPADGMAEAILRYRIGCQCAGLQAGGEGGRT